MKKIFEQREIDKLSDIIHSLGKTIVVTSGGVDPIHEGHISLIRHAKKLGDILVFIANDDEFLIRKKSYIFTPRSTRLIILEEMCNIDFVLPYYDGTMNVAQALRILKPHVFAKGGDRRPGNLNQLELDTAKEIGCEVMYGVGGFDKLQSSSDMVEQGEYFKILTESLKKGSLLRKNVMDDFPI